MHDVRCFLPKVINIDIAVHSDEKIFWATSHDSDIAQDAGRFIEKQAIGDRTGFLSKIARRHSLEKFQGTFASDLDSLQCRYIKQPDDFPNGTGFSADDRRPKF